jgi:2-polyprenyl-6-methoxyphenol hydroxylase-like FAD-dependent oxidoreductase
MLDVIVIGGGLGGLCLAQGLTGAGIPVHVYERDASAQFRDQGYRITIKAEGAAALRACLPPDLYDLALRTAIRSATHMAFFDEQLRPSFVKPDLYIPPGDAGFGVNRLTLREILLLGLEDRVTFGRTFQLSDAATGAATLVVGADGTNSAVRKHLLPDARLDDVGDAVYGRTPITADLLAAVPEILVDSFGRVRGRDGVSMGVATCRAMGHDPRLTRIPDYFSWTVSSTPELRGAEPSTLHAYASEVIAGWHPALRRVLAEADVDATFPVVIRSARPVAHWRTGQQSGRITLLGDAIHTMSPGRGEGANVALRDAAALTRELIDVASGRQSLETALGLYELEMLEHGFAAVSASLHQPFGPRPSR